MIECVVKADDIFTKVQRIRRSQDQIVAGECGCAGRGISERTCFRKRAIHIGDCHSIWRDIRADVISGNGGRSSRKHQLQRLSASHESGKIACEHGCARDAKGSGILLLPQTLELLPHEKEQFVALDRATQRVAKIVID